MPMARLTTAAAVEIRRRARRWSGLAGIGADLRRNDQTWEARGLVDELDLDGYAEVEFRRDAHGEPVLARRDSWGYRAGKFVRRNRASVGASAAALLLVVVLTVLYTIRLGAERDQHRLAAQQAGQVSDFLIDLLAANLKGLFLQASNMMMLTPVFIISILESTRPAFTHSYSISSSLPTLASTGTR